MENIYYLIHESNTRFSRINNEQICLYMDYICYLALSIRLLSQIIRALYKRSVHFNAYPLNIYHIQYLSSNLGTRNSKSK